MFTGFTNETVEYFLNLRFHNETSFFHDTHDKYIAHVQTPFYQFIEALAPHMQKIDPLMEVRPHKCLARIHRDTRFSNDKSPYRDHLWLLFRRAAEPREGAVMYWFEFGPDRLEWGLGFWGENRPAMDMLRRRMAAQPLEYVTLMESLELPKNSLVLGGQDFKRISIPGTVPDTLRPWYVKRDLYIWHEHPNYKWAFEENLTKRVLKDFRTLAPLYRTLRGCMEDLTQ